MILMSLTNNLTGFDPKSSEVLAQFEAPPDGQEVDKARLSPFLRALLAIDGTVTHFIESYQSERVCVLKIGQGEVVLPNDVPLLQVESGTEVLTRQVLLKGCNSKRFYVFGSSLIVADRLEEEARDLIMTPEIGLGSILRNTRLETFREIVWVYREHWQSLPPAVDVFETRELVSRTYQVIHNQRPIMLINEKFPANL